MTDDVAPETALDVPALAAALGLTLPPLPPLTELERTCLSALAPRESEPETPLPWRRTSEVGGTDGSRHSGTLAALERRGYVTSARRGMTAMPRGAQRVANAPRVYQLTDAGVAVLEALWLWTHVPTWARHPRLPRVLSRQAWRRMQREAREVSAALHEVPTFPRVSLWLDAAGLRVIGPVIPRGVAGWLPRVQDPGALTIPEWIAEIERLAALAAAGTPVIAPRYRDLTAPDDPTPRAR